MIEVVKSRHGLKCTYIYGLRDPRTKLIRYIGKSDDPHLRLSGHMKDASKCHRVHWLNELKVCGLTPEVVILEEICGEWDWRESERHWIAYGRAQGWTLTNNTSGGDGVPDLPTETRQRMASVWRGRTHTEQTKALIARSSSARKKSTESRLAMSKIMKGRSITWTQKLRKPHTKLSDEQRATIRVKLTEGSTMIALARQYSVHVSVIKRERMIVSAA